MKKIIISLLLLLGITLNANEILLGTTTSLDDTGFLSDVAHIFKEETGVTLKWIAKGLGKLLN